MITRRSSRLLEKKVLKEEKKEDDGEKQVCDQADHLQSSGNKKSQVARRKSSTYSKLKPQVPKLQATTRRKQSVESTTRILDESKQHATGDQDDHGMKEVEQQGGKRLKHATIIFNLSETDPIIRHLKESSGTDCVENNQRRANIETEILDQIALEGLNGVTLIKLFNLLDALNPNLRCTQDERSSNFVWSILLNKHLNYPPVSNVQAFYVDSNLNSNEPLSNPDGRNIAMEKPIALPSQTQKRFATCDSTLYPIQEGLILGSCKNYLTRMDITGEILDSFKRDGSLNSMHHLNVKYGLENVFFVACQAIRTKAVIPDWADPNIDIKLREYCALELIGKSRNLGTVFPNDKKFGRYRIMLMAKGFITQFQETSSSPIEHHLRRFSQSKRRAQKLDTLPNNSNYDDEANDLEKPLSSSYCCDPGKLKSDRSILTMVYDVIAESNGLMQLEIRRKLKLPKFHIRNHLKNLLSIGMIYSKARKSNPDRIGSRIFKTTHKLTKRRRAKDELAKPTGIMASWDETDLRAKKIIGHKRSSFSKAEDSLLILCRITSNLIDPCLKLSWCVHKRVVRDLLHKELVEAHDKTSDACLRRIKYLKRLPNNIMSINELSAELSDDPDIRRLIQPDKPQCSDEKLNKLFVQVLRTVRAKIPNLLGISSSLSSSTRPTATRIGNQVTDLRLAAAGRPPPPSSGLRILDQTNELSSMKSGDPIDGQREEFVIKDYDELKEKYEMKEIDCQSVASMLSRSQTYEKAKNVVDVKFNNACLVTMAFTLTSCFQSKEERSRRYRSLILLDKFYSNYPDKLVSSMISKLNKRSLLTRKCSADKASLYKPHSRMSLKLNQNVLFLLNRYQSHSLIQLAHTINQTYQINLNESNEMASIALLTSLCSLSSFNLFMDLKIPPNVVRIDEGNENFKSLCNRANPGTREILSRFMSRCGRSGSLAMLKQQQQKHPHHQASETEPNLATTSSGGGGPSLREETAPAESQITNNKMDDSRRALFLLRHELKAHTLDKCGSLADCLIVQPCNIRFYSDEKLELRSKPLELFFEQAKPLDLIEPVEGEHPTTTTTTNWLVKSFRFLNDDNNHEQELELKQEPEPEPERELEPEQEQEQEQERELPEQDDKDPNDGNSDTAATTPPPPPPPPTVDVEFNARLWKTIDGKIHLPTLFKLIESLLSWIIVFPGVERDTLQSEFGHLMPVEHLLELLSLMESLELILSLKLEAPRRKPRLFGYKQLDEECKSNGVDLAPMIAYEPSANAYLNYCQLLNYFK